jgi:SAM-dependent methyltransferase
MVRARSLTNVKIHELDLTTDDLPAGDYDFAWCRWVVSFVDNPPLLIQKLGRVMPNGSLSIFHEYGHYETWRFFPRLPMQERFREHVIATWRESGGEPDGAARLPELLADNGFVIRSARPHVFCLRPSDYMWQWPATFIEIYLPRLIQMGRIDQKFAGKVRADLASAERNRNSFMLTPLVLEIIAEKIN